MPRNTFEVGDIVRRTEYNGTLTVGYQYVVSGVTRYGILLEGYEEHDDYDPDYFELVSRSTSPKKGERYKKEREYVHA